MTAFPIEDAAEAYRFMQQTRHIGKVVLTIGESFRRSWRRQLPGDWWSRRIRAEGGGNPRLGGGTPFGAGGTQRGQSGGRDRDRSDAAQRSFRCGRARPMSREGGGCRRHDRSLRGGCSLYEE